MKQQQAGRVSACTIGPSGAPDRGSERTAHRVVLPRVSRGRGLLRRGLVASLRPVDAAAALPGFGFVPTFVEADVVVFVVVVGSVSGWEFFLTGENEGDTGACWLCRPCRACRPCIQTLKRVRGACSRGSEHLVHLACVRIERSSKAAAQRGPAAGIVCSASDPGETIW